MLLLAPGCSNKQKAASSITRRKRTGVHMGATFKGGEEQDGVNEVVVGGRLCDSTDTPMSHSALLDRTKNTLFDYYYYYLSIK